MNSNMAELEKQYSGLHPAGSANLPARSGVWLTSHSLSILLSKTAGDKMLLPCDCAQAQHHRLQACRLL